MSITNIVDVVLVLFIALWGVLGLKRGVIKEGVMTLGTLIVFILAFYLKNPIAEFLSLHLPFFNLFGMFKGITALNIILYQLLAFLIVVLLLQVVLNIIIKISSLIEKILKFTIILAIPSKVLGFILGLVEGFIISYIVLFVLNMPIFNISYVNNSVLGNKILNNTPILSNIAGGFVNTVDDIYNLGKDYYDENSSSNEFNLNSIDVMLKNKVISVDYVDKLISNGKINITGIDSVINKYR